MNLPRSIPLEWSPALWLATFFVHALIALSALPAEVPMWAKALVWAGCAASWVMSVRHAILLKRAVLVPDADGAVLRVSDVDARGRVFRDSARLGPLLVLHWVSEQSGGERYFCLLQSSFSVEDWRQLNVWLRWRVQS